MEEKRKKEKAAEEKAAERKAAVEKKAMEKERKYEMKEMKFSLFDDNQDWAFEDMGGKKEEEPRNVQIRSEVDPLGVEVAPQGQYLNVDTNVLSGSEPSAEEEVEVEIDV